MRIINQLGADFPYEEILVSPEDEWIHARSISDSSAMYFIARYSSEEKAKKAMNKLHSCYQNGLKNAIFRFPQEDEI